MNIQATAAYLRAEQLSTTTQERVQRQEQQRSKAKEEEKQTSARQQGEKTPSPAEMPKQPAPERTIFNRRGNLTQNYLPKGTLFDRAG